MVMVTPFLTHSVVIVNVKLANLNCRIL